jgi:hypothetical protein
MPCRACSIQRSGCTSTVPAERSWFWTWIGCTCSHSTMHSHLHDDSCMQVCAYLAELGARHSTFCSQQQAYPGS